MEIERIGSEEIDTRIEELEDECAEAGDFRAPGQGITPEHITLMKLRALLKLRDELVDAVGEDGWGYGVELYSADTFHIYARELAEDIGAVPDDGAWPLPHIDWEAAAKELSMDYSGVVFAGRIWYYRAM